LVFGEFSSANLWLSKFIAELKNKKVAGLLWAELKISSAKFDSANFLLRYKK
jgi:hypothetical protein